MCASISDGACILIVMMTSLVINHNDVNDDDVIQMGHTDVNIYDVL